METQLRGLRWRKLGVTLVNTRNIYARGHPLEVFDAIFRHAARRQSPPPDEPYFFHPLQPTGWRVSKGREYRLEVIFPVSSAQVIGRFCENLAAHLRDPRHNFDLKEVTGPTERTLAQLEAESEPLDLSAGEVCLEFVTPLAFPVADRHRRWMISTEALFGLFTQRFQRLFGIEVTVNAEALAGVEALCHYWEYDEPRHRSKSGSGKAYLNGCFGPLYLKGNLTPLLPLLRASAELHTGNRVGFGHGFYRLRARRPFFDARLKNPTEWLRSHQELAEQSETPDAFLHPLTSPQEAVQSLVAEVCERRYEPSPARGVVCPKRSGGGERTIALLESRDKLAHHVLSRMLSPVLERLFEDSSVGYREGRSVETARHAIAQAYREGYIWALESDVEAFFDELDWDILRAQLRRYLPAADELTLELLDRCIRAPLLINGAPVHRARGVLQGSPLSPLLSNLYLDPFDEAAHRAGLRLVRYADDFLVLTRTQEEAERALASVEESLAKLKLGIRRDKTGITPVEAGFSFLGMDLGPAMDESFVERTTLRKPLFVSQQYAFIGIDTDRLTLRRDDQLLASLPLNRIGEIVVLGNNGVSTRLLQRCGELGIPVSFCTATGYHRNTLRPDSRAYFDLCGRHLARREAMTEATALDCARRIVAAKIGNYLAWMRESSAPDDAPLKTELEDTLAHLDNAANVDEVRGLEGIAAQRLFRWVNDKVKDDAFRAPRRERRTQRNPYNSLLDFTYSLLFTRLNVLTRGRGLNPYLGWLHSPKDAFESLVCDLQEPFRCRMDRFIIKLINRRVIHGDDFQKLPDERLRLQGDALGRFLQAFEQEQHIRLASDPGTLAQLLHAQVSSIERWARDGTRPIFYNAHPRPLPSR